MNFVQASSGLLPMVLFFQNVRRVLPPKCCASTPALRSACFRPHLLKESPPLSLFYFELRSASSRDSGWGGREIDRHAPRESRSFHRSLSRSGPFSFAAPGPETALCWGYFFLGKRTSHVFPFLRFFPCYSSLVGTPPWGIRNFGIVIVFRFFPHEILMPFFLPVCPPFGLFPFFGNESLPVVVLRHEPGVEEKVVPAFVLFKELTVLRRSPIH